MNKSKKYGKGDLYDQRKLLPKIMNYLHCDREKAKEVFNKLKEDANKEIPDFNKYINKKMTNKTTFEKELKCCICGNVIGKINNNIEEEVVCLSCYHYDKDFDN